MLTASLVLDAFFSLWLLIGDLILVEFILYLCARVIFFLSLVKVSGTVIGVAAFVVH